jgi:hypothetical protein
LQNSQNNKLTVSYGRELIARPGREQLLPDGVFRYHDKTGGTNMSAPSVIQRDKTMLHKWFGTKRGTHWRIAGSVAVIIFSGYLIYNNRGSNPTTVTTTPATEQTPAPMTPGRSK